MSTPTTTAQQTFDGFTDAQKKSIVDAYLAANAKKDGYIDIGCTKESAAPSLMIVFAALTGVFGILFVIFIIMYISKRGQLLKCIKPTQ